MFDESKADKAVKFINSLCHTQDWHGKPFNLMEWEEKIIRDLFGTVNEDGTRQYREAYISTARKNGKSEIASAIAVYCLFGDGVNGAEIYCNAGDRDQASKVYDQAREMVEQNETLLKYSKIIPSTKRIVYQKRNSFLRVLSHEAETKHGFNVACAINDELHVWPNRRLYTVMKTGTGVRLQPLIINVTTAGHDRTSLCWEIYDYAKKVQSGILEDPTFYTAIFEMDEKDDWTDERNWYKANPGLGVYRQLKEIREAFKRARDIAAFENEFRQLYLNQWTEQAVRLIPMDAWDACDETFFMDNMRGCPCYCGLDLASSVDIAAFVVVFPDDDMINVQPYFFVPEEMVKKKLVNGQAIFDTWTRQGFIISTPGNVIDYAYIEEKIKEIASNHQVMGVVYDRWGAVQISQRLQEIGINVIPMGQGFASMSAPTKELLNYILKKKIRHNGNPVLRWMASNVAGKRDPAGNIKPDREKSGDKIDGIVSLIMALDQIIRNGEGKSIYDERGILFLEIEEKNETGEKEEEPEEKIAKKQNLSSLMKCLRCSYKNPSDQLFCGNCGMKIARTENVAIT